MMDSLDRSIGFRVISSDDYVGTVEEIVYGAENRLSALVIGTRLSEKPFVLVGVEEVLDCSERDGLLILSPSWRSSAVEISDAERLVA
jgi:PRC-barrel domain